MNRRWKDGAARRPLAYDDDLAPKPTYAAIANQFGGASQRPLPWSIPE